LFLFFFQCFLSKNTRFLCFSVFLLCFGTLYSVDTSLFKVADFITPAGDQPFAVSEIEERFKNNERHVVLAGATGTGKSASTAWVLERLNRPTLIITPNKVLTAQLASELRELLPNSFVGFFVSHFAHYRPEAYMPSTDTFIEKDSSIDDALERLRHEATLNALTRRDTVVVASVSALYGLGRPKEYLGLSLEVSSALDFTLEQFLARLVEMGYARNDTVLDRGLFRLRGDTLEVYSAASDHVLRVEFFGDEIDEVKVLDAVNRNVIANPSKDKPFLLFPTTHHVTTSVQRTAALKSIRAELSLRHKELLSQNKVLEAHRLLTRTEHDLELIETTGSCKGIENYSRHFDQRKEGQPPFCLLDYFPKDFLLVLDESHVTLPQINAMYEADRSRKQTLVDYGFRLPSALDNRPLSGLEFWSKVSDTLYLSATPGPTELSRSRGVVDQVIRPTGLTDPEVDVLPNKDRMIDLLRRIRTGIENNTRTLVTTLTKTQAEQLTEFFLKNDLKAAYLHSDVDTKTRLELLTKLRRGQLHVLVGVNLLREGLDLPEVALVAIFDADRQGFLRSYSALIQTIGRAARHPQGRVVLYADTVSPAMRNAIDETSRRRNIQKEFNYSNGIVPTALSKSFGSVMQDSTSTVQKSSTTSVSDKDLSAQDLLKELLFEAETLQKDMRKAADALQFETAALLRDSLRTLRIQIEELKETL